MPISSLDEAIAAAEAAGQTDLREYLIGLKEFSDDIFRNDGAGDGLRALRNNARALARSMDEFLGNVDLVSADTADRVRRLRERLWPGSTSSVGADQSGTGETREVVFTPRYEVKGKWPTLGSVVPRDAGSAGDLIEEAEKGRYWLSGVGKDIEFPRSYVDEKVADPNERLLQMEEKIHKREEFLREKELELRAMEARMAGEVEGAGLAEVKEDDRGKVKTGVRRLDDLLCGGLPRGAQIMLYGPPFSGMDVLLNTFLATGLKQGAPAIYVVTSKTATELLDSVKLILPNVEDYLGKGRLMMVDAHSKFLGCDVGARQNIFYVDSPTNLDALQLAMENARKSLSTDKLPRLVFDTLSTLIAYDDEGSRVYKFLDVLRSRCKQNKVAAIYSAERGTQSDSEVQTLKHLLDGVLEFNTDDLKTFLRVEGAGDARTRAWVEYGFDTRSITVKGSFAVDHIR